MNLDVQLFVLQYISFQSLHCGAASTIIHRIATHVVTEMVRMFHMHVTKPHSNFTVSMFEKQGLAEIQDSPLGAH